MTRLAMTIALFMGAVSSLAAQEEERRGATITGVVIDSLDQPIPGADIVANPGRYRVRSDSAGNFRITGLDGGAYSVTARKIGYAPDRWDLSVSKNGQLNVKFVLARRTQLDTVVVVAKGDCPMYSLDGFACRRHYGGGIFLDYPEIDELRAHQTADLFRDIPGFRVAVRSSRYGPIRVAVPANNFGCITSLVNGLPASPANQVPQNPADLSAIEIYSRPDSVPEAYQRHTWPTSGGLSRTGRCAVVVYWTIWAPMEKKQ